MSSLSDQQFESILLRLESGESLASVQADFPHLQEDIAALQDLQDFFAAQRSLVKPDPQGLKSVLRQIDLRRTSPDEESTWGAFFIRFSRYAGFVLPAVLVLGVTGYLWQAPFNQPLPTIIPVPVQEMTAFQAVESGAIPRIARSTMASPAMMMAEETPLSDNDSVIRIEMDMEALAQSLSDEFVSDMAEFKSTKKNLEPIFTEQLFSYQNSTSL